MPYLYPDSPGYAPSHPSQYPTRPSPLQVQGSTSFGGLNANTKIQPDLWVMQQVRELLPLARQGSAEAVIQLYSLQQSYPDSWDGAELKSIDLRPFQSQVEKGEFREIIQGLHCFNIFARMEHPEATKLAASLNLDQFSKHISSTDIKILQEIVTGLKTLIALKHPQAKNILHGIKLDTLKNPLEAGNLDCIALFEELKKAQHPQVISILKNLSLQPLFQRASNSEDYQEVYKIARRLKKLGELGVPKAIDLAKTAFERASLLERELEKCNPNPFCFNGEWEFRPNVRIGYEGLFSNRSFHQFNLGTRLFFYNRELSSFRSPNSFALGPEVQFHTGDGKRNAGSFGLALRYRRLAPSSAEYAGWASWGIDLSVQGGVGHLDLTEQENHFEGTYRFIAADASLYGSFFFLSAFVGVGLRKEYWPQGINAAGQEVDAESNLYPAFTIGGGVY